jgi:hypothetical protein
MASPADDSLPCSSFGKSFISSYLRTTSIRMTTTVVKSPDHSTASA